MIRTGIVGISGFSGKILFELLNKHPSVSITYVSANNTTGTIGDIWPDLKGQSGLTCNPYNADSAITNCDIVFLAVPHTISMTITPQLLKAKKRVIDLSGDYRLKTADVFKTWYKKDHTDPENLASAVYGLPELFRAKIATAQLISNPGCYPTAALLGLIPIVATYDNVVQSIIIDAKSGISGAGKKACEKLATEITNENFKAYKVLDHQHTPEIDLYLSGLAGTKQAVTFVPHLLPVNRGILETIYVQLNEEITYDKIYSLYKKFYKTEKFVRIMPEGAQPELTNVVGTNFCDIGIAMSADNKTIVITSAIDNLLKGASGQAVQNMNILCGFKEESGL